MAWSKENRHIVDEKTGCWVWQLASNKLGYGKTWDPVKRKVVEAHRFYYEIKFGPIPQGMELDHTCENPRCVNPLHMEPVTHVENVRRGKSTKLTEGQVEEIRALRGQMIQRKIAAKFGVSRSSVNQIQRGVSWKNLL